MSNASVTTIIILSEIILIETVLIIGWIAYMLFKEKKKASNLDKLLKSFMSGTDNRKSQLAEAYKKPESITDDEYKIILQGITDSELHLFKYFIAAAYSKNTNALDALSTETQKVAMSPTAFFSEKDSPNNQPDDSTPDVDVDNAIDELLSDDENIEFDEDKDPALDLSGPETQSNESIDETALPDDEIAEIPSELLTASSPEVEAISTEQPISTNDKPEK